MSRSGPSGCTIGEIYPHVERKAFQMLVRRERVGERSHILVEQETWRRGTGDNKELDV